MKISVEVDTKGLELLQKRVKEINDPAGTALGNWAVNIHSKILANLTGAKLKVRSGRLRSKQQFPLLTKSGDIIRAEFVNKTEYAAIHEYGGKTPAHVIVPKIKKALKFRMGGNVIFARKINHPGSKIKATHFMGEPIDDGLPKLRAAIKGAIVRRLNGE